MSRPIETFSVAGAGVVGTSVVVVVTVVLCSRDFVLLPAVDFGASRPERPRPVALRTSVRKPSRRPLGSLFPRLLPPAGVAARRAGASAVLVAALRDRAVGVAFVRTMAAAGVARAAASTMATAMTTTTAAAMTTAAAAAAAAIAPTIFREGTPGIEHLRRERDGKRLETQRDAKGQGRNSKHYPRVLHRMRVRHAKWGRRRSREGIPRQAATERN